uniref:Si:dkey-238d18.9 n=1 Tax=Myripristis murdjan TaxID=586833 RepID=A0A667Z8G4_9TELE
HLDIFHWMLYCRAMMSRGWSFTTPMDALTRSCVVIPCSFQEEHEPLTDLRGIWYNRDGDNVYHNGQSQVYDHFKGRTRILGDLDRQNCSLEIDDIKPFDNGPFCFRAERGNTKYRFNNSCVFIVMRASPEKPVMTPVPAEVDAGSAVNVTCSVTHTCSSHPPEFSWSVQTLTTEVKHTRTERGTWETSSTVTFEATGGDGVKNLTCTAQFWRGKMQTRTVCLQRAYFLQQCFPNRKSIWNRLSEHHARNIWVLMKSAVFFPPCVKCFMFPFLKISRGAVEGRANWQKETPAK